MTEIEVDFSDKKDFIRTLLTLKFTCLGDELVGNLKTFLALDKHQKLLRTIKKDDVKNFVNEQKKISSNSYCVTLYLPEDGALDDKQAKEALLAAAYYPKELDQEEDHSSGKFLYLCEPLAYSARYGMTKALQKLIAILEEAKYEYDPHSNFYHFLEQEGKKISLEGQAIPLYFEGLEDVFVTERRSYYEFLDNKKRNHYLDWNRLNALWAIIKAKYDNFMTLEESSKEKLIAAKLKEPSPPFFSYKAAVYEEFKKNYPEKKSSELTALIAETWNNLDKETKGKYERDYEMNLEQHNQAWETREEETMKLKKAKCDKKPVFLTNIFKSIKMNFVDRVTGYGHIDNTDDQYKHYWEFHDSWSDALSYVKAQFRKHLNEYRIKFQDIDHSRSVDDHDEGTCTTGVSRKFEATILDFVNPRKYSISEEMLILDLKHQLRQASKTQTYLIIQMLKERDFNPQAIRDVILCVPKVELTPMEIHDWEMKFNSEYIHPGWR